MYSRSKILAVSLVLLLPLGLFTMPLVSEQAIVQEEPANLILAGWDYPDEYGHGIEVLWFYENSTGSWVPILTPAFIFSDADLRIEVNYTANTAIKLIMTCNINHSLFDFGPDKSENASARAIMRTSIEVSNISGVVFSQQNMTWDGSVFDDTESTWAISYEVVINVIIEGGTIYTAIVTYEVFY